MRVTPTGSIMAATVCSPMKEASMPQTKVMPKLIQNTLVPVTLTMASAIRLSSFCLTTATASMSEPMIKSTESVIRLFATVVESRPSRRTWLTMIISATDGRGTGSGMKRITAMADTERTIWPSWVRPAGVGAAMARKPRTSATMNQRRFQTSAKSRLSRNSR